MKKAFVLLIALLMLATVSACAKKEEAAPDPDLPEMIPDELCGTYTDEIAGRCNAQVEAGGITIDWSSSAFEHAHYELSTDYDAENSRINYTNGVYKIVTYESEEKFFEETVYENGTGYFEISDGKLIWHNDMEEGGDPVVLVNTEQFIGLPNPWIYTDDLDEAISHSGVEFAPPVEPALPDGFNFITYGAFNDGIIEVHYEGNGARMIIRKSKTYSGLDLSGDYNVYPYNWQITPKGVEVDCYGQQDGLINQAYFGNGEYNYSISVIAAEGEEDTGITADNINSLIMGMQ